MIYITSLLQLCIGNAPFRHTNAWRKCLDQIALCAWWEFFHCFISSFQLYLCRRTIFNFLVSILPLREDNFQFHPSILRLQEDNFQFPRFNFTFAGGQFSISTFHMTFAGGYPYQQNSITDPSLQPPHPQGVIMIVQSNFQNANIFPSDLFWRHVEERTLRMPSLWGKKSSFWWNTFEFLRQWQKKNWSTWTNFSNPWWTCRMCGRSMTGRS